MISKSSSDTKYVVTHDIRGHTREYFRQDIRVLAIPSYIVQLGYIHYFPQGEETDQSSKNGTSAHDNSLTLVL